MLKIRRLPVGQLQTNCYLVFDQKSAEAVIIDPGDDANYIIQMLADLDIKPTKIIATHGHFDHILAVAELKLAYGISFLLHPADKFLLKRMRSSAKHFLGIDPGPAPKVDKYLKEGEELKIGNCKLKIICTPGHTPGSISLYSKKIGVIFVGDVIFAGGGVGRTDYKYGNKQDLENSLKGLLKLPKNTVFYSGHGEEETIEKLIDEEK